MYYASICLNVAKCRKIINLCKSGKTPYCLLDLLIWENCLEVYLDRLMRGKPNE